eukprot:scaffold41322_cov17-Tisochrysis_lutea.AAC.3
MDRQLFFSNKLIRPGPCVDFICPYGLAGHQCPYSLPLADAGAEETTEESASVEQSKANKPLQCRAVLQGSLHAPSFIPPAVLTLKTSSAWSPSQMKKVYFVGVQ